MTVPPILYKYATSATALIVLETSKLRWTSPFVFNDCREFRRMPVFDPSLQASHATYIDTLLDAAFSVKPLDETRLNATSCSLLDTFRTAARLGLTREQLRETAMSTTGDFDEKAERALQSFSSGINGKEPRVLCVTDCYDSHNMWAYYGESHAGAVLAFRHVPEQSTPLQMARQVAYSERPPVVCSGLAFHLYGDTPELRRATVNAIAFTKSLEWSNEREWRCVTWRAPVGGKDYFDSLFLPEELDSVTLGHRMPKDTIQRVRTLVLKQYPSATLYQMATDQRGNLSRDRLI